MLKEGLEVEMVAKFTELTVEQVQTIKRKLYVKEGLTAFVRKSPPLTYSDTPTRFQTSLSFLPLNVS